MKTRSKALHFLVFFLIAGKVVCFVLFFCIWLIMMLSFVFGGEPKEPPFFLFLFFALFFLAMLVFIPLNILFYILMILDAAKRKFVSDSQRTMWIVLVAVSIILWYIPAYVYYFLHGRKPREISELGPVERH